jgi:hypothetical protein
MNQHWSFIGQTCRDRQRDLTVWLYKPEAELLFERIKNATKETLTKYDEPTITYQVDIVCKEWRDIVDTDVLNGDEDRSSKFVLEITAHYMW